MCLHTYIFIDLKIYAHTHDAYVIYIHIHIYMHTWIYAINVDPYKKASWGKKRVLFIQYVLNVIA